MAKAGLDSGSAQADSQLPIRPSWGEPSTGTAGGEPRQPTPGYGGRHPEFSDKARARMRETMVLSKRVPKRIRIDAQASTFTVVDDSGSVKTLHLDGKKLEEPVEGGGTVETTARWDHDAIVVERKVDGGGKVKTRYELGLGGTRLIAFVDLDGMMQGRSFTLHYLKVPPDSTGDTGASSAP